MLLSAEEAVSKTLVDDDDWPLPLAAVGPSGITGWARVAALPAVSGLVAGEPGRAPASGFGLPISSAGYGRALSRDDDEDDREDAGNGVEAEGAADPEDDDAANTEEDTEGVGASEAGTEEDAGTAEEDADESDSHEDELHVDVSHEKASASSSALEVATE